jgi:peptide/nickel transport system permease protein
MTRYLVRQFVISLIKLFVFLTFMFFFIQIMMPGDFVDQFAMGCDAACREEIRLQLGLDMSLWNRYFQWLGQVVRLDFGVSMSGEPIGDIFKRVIPPTLLVFVIGTVLSFMIGLWLGKITTWRERGIGSRLITMGGLVLFTSFPPWLTYLVTYLFTKGGVFQVVGGRGGLRPPTFHGLDRLLWQAVELSPSEVIIKMMICVVISSLFLLLLKVIYERLTKSKAPTLVLVFLAGLWAVSGWLLLGINDLAFDIMAIAYLPMITYILLAFGEFMLIMQASMRDVLNSEYIQTAQAKGLPVSIVRDRHAAQNALLPVLSRLVISLPYLITGVVIIESSVGWPGLGTNLWNALYWQNMPVVMDTLLIVGIISLGARLIIDVIAAYLDPRIRYQDPQINHA